MEELFVVALLSLTGRGVSTPRFAALQATASARSRHDSAPDDQKAQWNTTAAPLPSSSKQAATTGSRPRGGCLLPFPACAGHGQKARSAQSGTAWPTRMRVDRGSRPTVQIGQHGGIAAKGSGKEVMRQGERRLRKTTRPRFAPEAPAVSENSKTKDF